jgi:hypothetical protein
MVTVFRVTRRRGTRQFYALSALFVTVGALGSEIARMRWRTYTVGMTSIAVGREVAVAMGRGWCVVVIDAFMADCATIIFRREVTGHAVRIGATVKLTAVRGGLVLLVTFDTGILFMAGRAGIAIPRGVEAVCLALPGNGVVSGSGGLVTTVTGSFLVVTGCAVLGVQL